MPAVRPALFEFAACVGGGAVLVAGAAAADDVGAAGAELCPVGSGTTLVSRDVVGITTTGAVDVGGV